MIKNTNRGGFIDRQRKGVGVGEDVFENNEKKNKTTAVYRLDCVQSLIFFAKSPGVKVSKVTKRETQARGRDKRGRKLEKKTHVVWFLSKRT